MATDAAPTRLDDARSDRAGARVDRLTIRRLETIPVRAPLAREFRGSYYRMTHRATLILRLHTDEGVIGEAYVGDEDATAQAIDAVLHEEIEPRVLGLDAMATERC